LMKGQGFEALQREDTDEQTEPMMTGMDPSSPGADHDDGSAFYLNAEVLGKDDRTLIMKYHYKKSAGLTQASESPTQKGGLMSTLNEGRLNAMGSVHSAVAGPTHCGKYFADILVDSTKKAMARLGYYCEVNPAFINGKSDEIFVAVRVSHLRVDASRQGCLAIPCPAFFFRAFCCCCPRISIKPCWLCCCNCCKCCVMPINVDNVAQIVEDLLMDDPDAPLPIPVQIDGQVPEEQKLFLNRKGFYNVSLPDQGEEVETNVRTFKIGHH